MEALVYTMNTISYFVGGEILEAESRCATAIPLHFNHCATLVLKSAKSKPRLEVGKTNAFGVKG